MANALLDRYKDRGFVYINAHVEDSPSGPNHDGIIDWKDAKAWADGDYNGDGTIGSGEGGPGWPQKRIVLADAGSQLWNLYVQYCSGSDLACQLGCHVTPQVQVFDQGGITVDDTCRNNHDGKPGGACFQCGYDETYLEPILEALLPPQWCGDADP